jgi:putative oxidoreductase
VASDCSSIPAKWTSELQSLARIIFGFLLFRHGMEQVLGYPAAFTDHATMSVGGVVKLLAFPGGILIMLGLFTRPLCLVLSPLFLSYWFVGPLQIGLLPNRNLFGARGPSDPVLLNGFFFLYLALTGPGVWSVDRLLHRDAGSAPRDQAYAEPPTRQPRWGAVRGAQQTRLAASSVGALRIVAGFLFIHHGLEKVFGRFPVDITFLRALAASLELVGGPMLMAGLFTRPLAFLLSGEMAFAYFINHARDGFWPSFVEPNQEAAILNCFLFLFLWAVGPGAWSLDGLRRRRRERATVDGPVNLETRPV